MKYFKKKRKINRASNAVDAATTRACWGKKLHGYPGIAGKGGTTTNSRINEWMFEKELKEYKEGKVVATIPPAQMSPDVKQLQEDLVQLTRDLAGAGDTATGQVNPESASGRAILAVQQASQAPMTEQRETYKSFLEDVARIWLEYLIAYSETSGAKLEEVGTDSQTGEEYVIVTVVPQHILKELQASVKIDITPKGVYDRFAQEQTIENLFLKHAMVVTDGVITALYQITERGGSIKAYAPVSGQKYVQHDGRLMLGMKMYSYGGNHLFDGTIHNFEVWDYAMTAEEVAEKLQ